MHPGQASYNPCMLDDLIPHPEGGAYAERFRSDLAIVHPRLQAERSAVTLIHFHLKAWEFSAWHRRPLMKSGCTPKAMVWNYSPGTARAR